MSPTSVSTSGSVESPFRLLSPQATVGEESQINPLGHKASISSGHEAEPSTYLSNSGTWQQMMLLRSAPMAAGHSVMGKRPSSESRKMVVKNDYQNSKNLGNISRYRNFESRYLTRSTDFHLSDFHLAGFNLLLQTYDI